MLYTESVSNPTLLVADLPRLADLAHGRALQLVVDNTFTCAPRSGDGAAAGGGERGCLAGAGGEASTCMTVVAWGLA